LCYQGKYGDFQDKTRKEEFVAAGCFHDFNLLERKGGDDGIELHHTQRRPLNLGGNHQFCQQFD
jgi:hypothetical protein